MTTGDFDPLATVTRAVSKSGSEVIAPARLRCVYPPELNWSVQLHESPVLVGRTAPPVPLQHGTVSRKHFEVSWDPESRSHFGRDLGSHNGSRVDGLDMGGTPSLLADQTVLQLGDVCLVYEKHLDADHSPAVSREAIPGRAPAIVKLRNDIARAAPDPSAVLLLGQTGTGKEWASREIHRLSGRTGRFVAINCSALSPQIIDSQLFGHVRGAFTDAKTDQAGLFRTANEGTLFLDEVGEMPLSLQPKLLRALQEGEVQPVGSSKTIRVNVRVIAATNRDLTAEIEAGTFRQDLFARLALWTLNIPAIAGRRGDIIGWIDRLHAHWLAQRPAHPQRAPLSLSPEAAESVLLHPWRGNLREIDRLVHDLASAPNLARPVAHGALPGWLRPKSGAGSSAAAIEPSASAPAPKPAGRASNRRPVPSREDFVAVFEQLDGNVRAIAKHFERDRRQIYRWIESYELSDRRPKR